MKENAIGECQGCDLNDSTKTNCRSCELSFDNNCLACGPFSNPETELAPTCACSQYNSATIFNGRRPCRSAQCMSIIGCSECDVLNKCVSCTTDTHVIINNGANCAAGPCPAATFPKFTHFRLNAFCAACPQNCAQCKDEKSCDQCQEGIQNLGEGLCKKISFRFKFQIKNSTNKSIIDTYTAVLDIIITQADDSQLDVGYLNTYASKSEYKLFSFLPEDAVEESKYELFNDSTIRIFVKIGKKYSDTKLTFKIKKDDSKIIQQVQLENETKEIKIPVPAFFTKEELNSVGSKAETMGSTNQVAGKTAEYVSLALGSLGLDPTGSFLKFSQMNKLISRFRFLKIEFGILLTKFFQSSADKYDPESTLGEKYILEHTKGFLGKFNEEKVSLTIFEKEWINVMIYITAWILKSQTFVILIISSDTQQITRMQCHFVNFAQKIHFVAFNKIIIDLIFYGLRTISHTRDLSVIEISNTVVLLFLVFFDVCEVWILTSSTVIQENQFDLFRKKQGDQSPKSKIEEKDKDIDQDILVLYKLENKIDAEVDWNNKEFLKQ